MCFRVARRLKETTMGCSVAFVTTLRVRFRIIYVWVYIYMSSQSIGPKVVPVTAAARVGLRCNFLIFFENEKYICIRLASVLMW